MSTAEPLTDEQVVAANAMGLDLGKEAAKNSGFSLGELAPPEPPQYEQVLMKGNDSLSLGAIVNGLDFFVGYPIPPATSIL